MLGLILFISAQINEKAYQRAGEELAAVKRESVELKVKIVGKGQSSLAGSRKVWASWGIKWMCVFSFYSS